MVPRSLVGLDQNNILPRKCRSGRRYLPAPQDRPFKVGEYNVDAYERFNGSDGVFSGRLRCEIYQSRLFTSHQGFGMRVWQEDKLAFPLPFKDQCVWSQEVSFKFYWISVFFNFDFNNYYFQALGARDFSISKFVVFGRRARNLATACEKLEDSRGARLLEIIPFRRMVSDLQEISDFSVNAKTIGGPKGSILLIENLLKFYSLLINSLELSVS